VASTVISIAITPNCRTSYIVQDDLAGNLPGRVIPL